MRIKPRTKTASAPTEPLAAIQQRFGPIEYRDPKSLTPYANNPREHPEHQLVKLTACITQFGFPIPVLADEHYTIIAGHARVDAAKRVGLSEVPVIVARGWSKDQVKAFRIFDNKITEGAQWNKEKLAQEVIELLETAEVDLEIAFETAEIDLIMEGANEHGNSTDPADEQLELPSSPVSRGGDLFLLGKHRLLCGSSLIAANWERLMNGQVADMGCVDFPFNVPVAGHVCGLGKVQHAEFAQASGEMTRPEFTTFLTEGIGAMAAHLKDGAVAAMFMDWRHLLEMQTAIEANGLSLLNVCIWNKTNGGMGSLYRSKHELVFIAKKGSAPHTNNVQLGKHGRYRTNVWDYAGINTFGKSRMDDLS